MFQCHIIASRWPIVSYSCYLDVLCSSVRVFISCYWVHLVFPVTVLLLGSFPCHSIPLVFLTRAHPLGSLVSLGCSGCISVPCLWIPLTCISLYRVFVLLFFCVVIFFLHYLYSYASWFLLFHYVLMPLVSLDPVCILMYLLCYSV